MYVYFRVIEIYGVTSVDYILFIFYFLFILIFNYLNYDLLLICKTNS